MATWISLVVLSALAVSTLSLPGPDGAYNIPDVGTGQRSQYFVLHSDGTYKYGHDTGKGAFESAHSPSVGQQQGNFGYVDPEGNSLRVQYEAGERGFVAHGDHLPKPHPDFHAAHAEARARPSFVDPLASSNADATYNFKIAEDGHSRTEQSDSNGNIRGTYSYRDDNGQTRTFSYTAGRNTGFIIEGNDLPVSPDVPAGAGSTPAATRHSSNSDSSINFRATGSPSSTFIPSESQRPSPVYSTPENQHSSFAASQQESSSPVQATVNADGSYFFSFNAGDHSRSESADSDVNVEVQFSFVADDGATRRINYEAGANKGFQASGDHLPTPPSSTLVGNVASTRIREMSTSPFSIVQTSYQTPSVSSQSTATSRFTSKSSLASIQTHSAPTSSQATFQESNTRSDLRSDGSYSLAYETSSHSREETGDSDNNVDGDFSFVSDDGQRRQIKYEAGSETGFIVEGAHIPTGPVVPGAPSGQPTGKIVPVKEVPFVDSLANSNSDASYSFEFESEQYSRTESADANGNVQGTYTVADDDGTTRTYSFRGGEGIGFEKKEISSSRETPSSRSSLSQTTISPAHRPSSSSFNRQVAASTSTLSIPFRSSARSDNSQNFQFHQYDASKNPGKYGYVLRFD
ncbi:hypothetical protein SK128_001940 [Halocaridina rubra]|uniref:Uncharacterized protein n=1 Tax=Halocaridina rubra TaxID=373956 RepID=A0AAN9FU80_HALRR